MDSSVVPTSLSHLDAFLLIKALDSSLHIIQLPSVNIMSANGENMLAQNIRLFTYNNCVNIDVMLGTLC